MIIQRCCRPMAPEHCEKFDYHYEVIIIVLEPSDQVSDCVWRENESNSLCNRLTRAID